MIADFTHKKKAFLLGTPFLWLKINFTQNCAVPSIKALPQDDHKENIGQKKDTPVDGMPFLL